MAGSSDKPIDARKVDHHQLALAALIRAGGAARTFMVSFTGCLTSNVSVDSVLLLLISLASLQKVEGSWRDASVT